MFTEKFDNHVCPGDSIHCELGGYEFTASLHHDEDAHIDDDDCHNTDQAVTGCNDEQFANLLHAREAWFDDEWFYCGIVISAKYKGVLVAEHAASLWGIEANYPGSDNAYLTKVANELLEEAKQAAAEARQNLLEKLS